MNQSPYQLHSRLAESIRAAAHVRQQLDSGHLSRLGRLCRQVQYALLVFQSSCLRERTRS